MRILDTSKQSRTHLADDGGYSIPTAFLKRRAKGDLRFRESTGHTLSVGSHTYKTLKNKYWKVIKRVKIALGVELVRVPGKKTPLQQFGLEAFAHGSVPFAQYTPLRAGNLPVTTPALQHIA